MCTKLVLIKDGTLEETVVVGAGQWFAETVNGEDLYVVYSDGKLRVDLGYEMLCQVEIGEKPGEKLTWEEAVTHAMGGAVFLAFEDAL